VPIEPDDGREILRRAGIFGAVYAPTRTALEKDYFDAVGPVRDVLAHAGIHDFDAQPRGGRRRGQVVVLCDERTSSHQDAAYFRTERGDRRVRISGLQAWTDPDELLAFVPVGAVLHVLKLEDPATRIALDDPQTPLCRLLRNGLPEPDWEQAPAVDPYTYAQIRARRGQGRFRDSLFSTPNPHCAISGVGYPLLLEAAHIVPFSESFDHSQANGLILRADLHTLFDLHEITIDRMGIVRASPSVVEIDSYAAFNSQQALLDEYELAQKAPALQDHNGRCGWFAHDR
jgi:hypothetical protein